MIWERLRHSNVDEDTHGQIRTRRISRLPTTDTCFRRSIELTPTVKQGYRLLLQHLDDAGDPRSEDHRGRRDLLADLPRRPRLGAPGGSRRRGKDFAEASRCFQARPQERPAADQPARKLVDATWRQGWDLAIAEGRKRKRRPTASATAPCSRRPWAWMRATRPAGWRAGRSWRTAWATPTRRRSCSTAPRGRPHHRVAPALAVHVAAQAEGQALRRRWRPLRAELEGGHRPAADARGAPRRCSRRSPRSAGPGSGGEGAPGPDQATATAPVDQRSDRQPRRGSGSAWANLLSSALPAIGGAGGLGQACNALPRAPTSSCSVRRSRSDALERPPQYAINYRTLRTLAQARELAAGLPRAQQEKLIEKSKSASSNSRKPAVWSTCRNVRTAMPAAARRRLKEYEDVFADLRRPEDDRSLRRPRLASPMPTTSHPATLPRPRQAASPRPASANASMPSGQAYDQLKDLETRPPTACSAHARRRLTGLRIGEPATATATGRGFSSPTLEMTISPLDEPADIDRFLADFRAWLEHQPDEVVATCGCPPRSQSTWRRWCGTSRRCATR